MSSSFWWRGMVGAGMFTAAYLWGWQEGYESHNSSIMLWLCAMAAFFAVGSLGS